MEQFRTPSIEMGGDSTLEWVKDNLLKTTQSAQRTQISRRFLPKRRASIDQAPGPRTAIAAPMVAKRMLLRRWAVPERASQISLTARSAPATGVQIPASKKSPHWPRLFAVQPIHSEPLPSVWRCRRKSAEFRPLSVAREVLAQASRLGT